MLAPAAGALISLFGVRVAFGINAASYVGSALVLTGLRARADLVRQVLERVGRSRRRGRRS